MAMKCGSLILTELIKESKGHFDKADYERQLNHGAAFDPN